MTGRNRKYPIIIIAGIITARITGKYLVIFQHDTWWYFINSMFVFSFILFCTSIIFYNSCYGNSGVAKKSKHIHNINILKTLLILCLFTTSFCRGISYEEQNIKKECEQNVGVPIKNKIKKIIHIFLGYNNESGVMIAFATGDKEEIPVNLRKKYSDSGAMHILALSGLHVGIIFTMLRRMLFLMGISHITRKLRLLAILSVIIFFINITGYSSSLARAALMTGIYQIWKILGYKIDKTALLFITAAILLMIKPDEISDIGFQLSFGAMAGIILIYPSMSDFINHYMSYSLTKKWQQSFKRTINTLIITPVAISICCQITTLPFCFYYFEKVPNYYLLTNIAVIPLTTCIIYLFVFCIISYFIYGNATFLCGILRLFVGILNTIVSYFA